MDGQMPAAPGMMAIGQKHHLPMRAIGLLTGIIQMAVIAAIPAALATQASRTV